MRNKNHIVQESIIQTDKKQIELDQIERKIIVKFFGKETIPDKTAVLFNILNIDPNKYIKIFENRLSPMLNAEGKINGLTLKSIIQFSKYKDISKVIDIPDSDFFLSDYIDLLIKTFIPGGR